MNGQQRNLLGPIFAEAIEASEHSEDKQREFLVIRKSLCDPDESYS